MEFRAPAAADKQNANAIEYLTKNLSDPEEGKEVVANLIRDLGNAVYAYPQWHPILTLPQKGSTKNVFSTSDIKAYNLLDHTIDFVRGFVTCPYSDSDAEELVDNLNAVNGLAAYRLNQVLYSDSAFPVVVEALDIVLEADGTIRSRDALAWFAQEIVKDAEHAQVAETWWNMRRYILGQPHGARSSLFVNKHVGLHMRKILDALNASGMFGPVKEVSLEMLSEQKRTDIGENLLRAAVGNWDRKAKEFEFELRDECCKAVINDTWDDGYELSIRVMIGDFDLYVSGFYYAERNELQTLEPTGKRKLAEKFT